jgi:hypothetical protein
MCFSAIEPPRGPMEKLRAPVNFRSRVIAAFRSARNIEYLKGLLRPKCGPRQLCDLGQKVYDFSSGSGRAYDILNSDPLARRGNARQASDLWSEVRRLNREFHDSMISVDVSLNDADNEPYHIRAFFDDSLRPPGLESLNCPDRPMFGSGSNLGGHNPDLVEPDPNHEEADWAWSPGNPTRTAEQAMAEFWGEERGLSETGVVTPCGPSIAEQALRGEWFYTSESGPRRQRYEGFPRWQRTGERNFDKDIGETLGVGAREASNQVRGWDMDRLRNPRGQEYRRYGARSSGAS